MSQTLQRHHGRTTPVRPPPRAARRGTRPPRRHGFNNDEDRSFLLDDKDRSNLSTDGGRGADRGRTCLATAGRR
jgi:hypothetical protein